MTFPCFVVNDCCEGVLSFGTRAVTIGVTIPKLYAVSNWGPKTNKKNPDITGNTVIYLILYEVVRNIRTWRVALGLTTTVSLTEISQFSCNFFGHYSRVVVIVIEVRITLTGIHSMYVVRSALQLSVSDISPEMCLWIFLVRVWG